MKTGFLGLMTVGLLAFGSFGAVSLADDPQILRFSQVSPGVYRSARPTAVGMSELYGQAFKSIVNLEDDPQAIAVEEAMANALGITFYSRPFSGFWAPNDTKVNEVLTFIANPENQPVLVHCEHGEDRTGMIIGLYRYKIEHRDAQAAYQEALDHGFHRVLLPLNHYFHERLDLED